MDARSPTLGFAFTVLPVILHVVGVGSTVMLKFIFEMSPGIGHLEGMYVLKVFLVRGASSMPLLSGASALCLCVFLVFGAGETSHNAARARAVPL